MSNPKTSKTDPKAEKAGKVCYKVDPKINCDARGNICAFYEAVLMSLMSLSDRQIIVHHIIYDQYRCYI